MLHKAGKPFDFSDFLLEDGFIAGISDPNGAADYIKNLKIAYPEQAENIDLAVKVYYGLKNVSSGPASGAKQKTWNAIIQKNGKEKKSYLKIAASILVLAGLSATAYYCLFRNNTSSIEKFATTNPASFEKSRLILSDGKSIYISDTESDIAYSTEGVNVLINDTIRISQKVKAEDFNEIIVPFGKFHSLKLSDGTKVWINAGSRMIYPPAFSGKSREVYVQGEAYFEVTKDKSRPFYVKTDKFRLEVLGTKFCVLADGKEDLFTALLLEGKVTLSSDQTRFAKGQEVDLTPGHLALLSEDGRSFKIAPVEYPENYIAWKNGYLIFNDEPLSELLQRVSRYYNIVIELKNSSSSLKISGKLDLKDDPERVLKGLSVIAKCRLMNEQGKYILY